MAWGGSQTITRPHGHLKIVATGFDTDTEVGTVIDFHSYPEFGGIYPKGSAMCMCVSRGSTDTTDTVAISLQGSIDGVQYTDVVDLTKTTQAATADTFGGCAYNNDLLNAPIRYVRIYATTVGAGNVLQATALIRLEQV